MVVFGMGMVAIAMIETLRGQALAPWVAAALTLVVSFGGTLLGCRGIGLVEGTARLGTSSISCSMREAVEELARKRVRLLMQTQAGSLNLVKGLFN